MNTSEVTNSLVSFVETFASNTETFHFLNVQDQSTSYTFNKQASSLEITFELSGTHNQSFYSSLQVIPLVAEIAGVGLFLFVIGYMISGLFSQRLFLRDVINRNFYMQKYQDDKGMMEMYEHYKENIDQLKHTNTLSQVHPGVLKKI